MIFHLDILLVLPSEIALKQTVFWKSNPNMDASEITCKTVKLLTYQLSDLCTFPVLMYVKFTIFRKSFVSLKTIVFVRAYYLL